MSYMSYLFMFYISWIQFWAFSVIFQLPYNGSAIEIIFFAKFSKYHPIFIAHVPHSDPQDTWLLSDHEENAQCTCSIAFLSLIMLYHFGQQISLENLFFLSFEFCYSQTPNDKIVGKTQGNVYFFLSQWIPNF